MMRLCAWVAVGLLGIAFVGGTGFGQDGKKDAKEGKTKGILPAGFKDLNLAKEQVSKIYGIQSDFKAKKKELEDEIVKLKAKERTEIMKVLSDEQKALFLKLSIGEESPKKGASKNDKK